jgi:hypothetical protein
MVAQRYRGAAALAKFEAEKPPEVLGGFFIVIDDLYGSCYNLCLRFIIEYQSFCHPDEGRTLWQLNDWRQYKSFQREKVLPSSG